MEEHKITRKQINSNMCFICGINNESGLKIRFYETDNNEVVCKFTPKDIHQSYPGRLHGGIAATVLDELVGRAIELIDKDAWAVTAELNLKYKKPLPLNTELTAKARALDFRHGLLIANGEIYLPNGDIAVTARGKFYKQDLNKIVGNLETSSLNDELFYLNNEKDPQFI